MRSSIITIPLLAGALTCLVACDKGPQKGDAPPTKAKSAAPAATPAPTAAGSNAKVDPSAASAPSNTAASKVKLEGKVYGKGVTQATSVQISTILDTPNAYAGKTVRVEGMVVDVCEKRGCWLAMAGDKPGQKMKFKVDDGVMVFPMTAKGKYAVAQGVVEVNKLSLEETRKHAVYVASEQGDKLDPKTITKPRTVVRLAGAGAVVRNKK